MSYINADIESCVPFKREYNLCNTDILIMLSATNQPITLIIKRLDSPSYRLVFNGTTDTWGILTIPTASLDTVSPYNDYYLEATLTNGGTPVQFLNSVYGSYHPSMILNFYTS